MVKLLLTCKRCGDKFDHIVVHERRTKKNKSLCDYCTILKNRERYSKKK